MPKQDKKLTTSKKWIDYSDDSQQEHQESKNNIHNDSKQNQQNEINNKLDKLNINAIQRSQLKKQLIEKLKNIKQKTIWVEISSENLQFLKAKIYQLNQIRNTPNSQIISVYPSRTKQNFYDVKVQIELCQKWINEGLDENNLIRLELPEKRERVEKTYDTHPRRQHHYYDQYKRQEQKQKYDQKQKNYQKYQRQRVENPPSHKFDKKKYVQKNPLREKIEHKVEEQLAVKRKQVKNKQVKQIKPKKGSKFYSKNPFEALNQSDE